MPHGVLIVESRPATEDEAALYHEWYGQTHIPEMIKVEGFVSARRLESLDGDTFIAIYEIEGDVEAAKAALAQASASMSPPRGVKLDPPPTVRYFSQID